MGFGDKFKKILGSVNEGDYSDSKNFKYLDDLIHSGEKTIVLDEDIVLGKDEESKYKNGIKLDVDGLVIEGNGHTIDAKGKTRIFEISNKTMLEEITFKNGYNEEKGGAIYNPSHGDLTVIWSYFENNNSNMGSAIFNEYGELFIEGVNFERNVANDGTLFNRDGNLSVSSSTFEYNQVNNAGGAVYNDGRSILRIEKSNFENNQANIGGAIYSDEGCTLIIDGSSFENNKAKKEAGAIFNGEDGDVDVDFCKFWSNESKFDAGAIKNCGDLNIGNSEFEGNFAENGYGGAIFNGEDNDLSINNSLIEGNVAGVSGGAIWCENEGTLELNQCGISDNEPNDIFENK